MDTAEDSFISAWLKADFPDEAAFVRQFCAEVGVSRFEFVPASYRYIAATRTPVRSAALLGLRFGSAVTYSAVRKLIL